MIGEKGVDTKGERSTTNVWGGNRKPVRGGKGVWGGCGKRANSELGPFRVFVQDVRNAQIPNLVDFGAETPKTPKSLVP